MRVRIGIGHPGRKDLVTDHVLHDFAKADHDWLEPLLGAIAEEAPYLAEGASDKFQSRVAHAVQSANAEENLTPRRASSLRPRRRRRRDRQPPRIDRSTAAASGHQSAPSRLRRWFGWA